MLLVLLSVATMVIVSTPKAHTNVSVMMVMKSRMIKMLYVQFLASMSLVYRSTVLISTSVQPVLTHVLMRMLHSVATISNPILFAVTLPGIPAVNAPSVGEIKMVDAFQWSYMDVWKERKLILTLH